MKWAGGVIGGQTGTKRVVKGWPRGLGQGPALSFTGGGGKAVNKAGISRYAALNMQDVSTVLNGFIGVISNVGVGLFSVLFITFFFMKDGTTIINSFLSLVKRERLFQVRKTIEDIKHLLSHYFLGLFL